MPTLRSNDVLAPAPRAPVLAGLRRRAGWEAARLWGRMPFAWRHATARRVGDFFLQQPSLDREFLLTNLTLCFPELSPAQREELARVNATEMVLAAMNQYRCWALSAAQMRAHVSVDNLSLVHTLRRHGPLMMLCPHFLGMEFAVTRLGLEGLMSVVYDRSRQADFEVWRQKMRARLGPCQFIPVGAPMRPLLRGLQTGTPALLLPDLDMGPHGAVFAPFFGIPAATVRTAAWCAAKTGAAVLPVSVQRVQGDEFLATVHAPITGLGFDVDAGTHRINASIEALVRAAPSQYWWAQPRFATRPAGEAALYSAAAMDFAARRFSAG
jgi:Kdo2-lipid IVA lauroyltransferase/acyltransferase